MGGEKQVALETLFHFPEILARQWYDVAVFFLAALVLGLVVAAISRLVGARCVTALLSAFVFAVAVSGWRVFRHNGPHMFWSLERAGAPYVSAIYRYESEHGRFPAASSELPVQAPLTEFGAFQYSVSEDGKSFNVGLGEYSRDGFVMWWSTECRCWQTDT